MARGGRECRESTRECNGDLVEKERFGRESLDCSPFRIGWLLCEEIESERFWAGQETVNWTCPLDEYVEFITLTATLACRNAKDTFWVLAADTSSQVVL